MNEYLAKFTLLLTVDDYDEGTTDVPPNNMENNKKCSFHVAEYISSHQPHVDYLWFTRRKLTNNVQLC